MALKIKEINAIVDALDFINSNSDGADQDDLHDEMVSLLYGIVAKEKKSQHKRRVKYYLNKRKKQIK